MPGIEGSIGAIAAADPAAQEAYVRGSGRGDSRTWTTAPQWHTATLDVVRRHSGRAGALPLDYNNGSSVLAAVLFHCMLNVSGFNYGPTYSLVTVDIILMVAAATTRFRHVRAHSTAGGP
jgi:hypothetical protein